ncbi:MAG: dependent methyltransferase [Caulobacteraceae bacterium]|jgi:23S rRNA (cytosine1962-C5)-methyltransferase|nr:dependent methyltransferase [Caulobacteraceae bacterium]
MRTGSWRDYALLDSGGGRKLERFGPWVVTRPEPQCLWAPRLSSEAWSEAHAAFEPADEDEAGRWKLHAAAPASWPMTWREVTFQARLTAFRHLAVFPEQAANWAWLSDRVRACAASPRILNLFGYTGVASLVCAAAGAAVTHVDASKKAVGWARENAALSGLAEAPVRWICEDARKYVQREVRRGARYEGIILDPPKYGRGPGGEVWRLYDDLPDLVSGCAALLAENPSFLLLNAYSERISGLALAGLLGEALAERGGRIDWGELALMEEAGARGVGLSFFARWSAG